MLLLPHTALQPVLHDGRIKPLSTISTEEELLAPNQDGTFSPLSENTIPVYDIPYLRTATKVLRLPSKAALIVEHYLHLVPFLAIILISYILALFSKSALVIGFIIHTIYLAARTFVLGRPPVSNMAETMIYVPWVGQAASLALHFFSKNRLVLFASSLIGLALFSLLFFAKQDLGLENVQAVLDSNYWLTVHVLMVVGSYAFFLIAGVLAHIALLKPKASLEPIILRCIYLGLTLLIPGTLLGGVWAAESWGRFWDWDPKESWAFISAAIYLIFVHAHYFKKIGLFGLSIGAVIGLNAITFTWYGVNYILGKGLHSYGFGSGGTMYYFIFLGVELLFLIFLIAKKRRFV